METQLAGRVALASSRIAVLKAPPGRLQHPSDPVVEAIDRLGANRAPAADDPEKDLLPEVVVVERREGGIQAAVAGATDHFAAALEQFSARSVIALERLDKQ